MRLEFVMNIDPPKTTQQQHRFGGYGANGRAIIYDSPRLKAARRTLHDHLALHAPKAPFEGPLYLQTTWEFSVQDKKKWGLLKTTRPDTDNLEKMLKDEMTKCGFWHDDAQVAVEVTQKRWVKLGEGCIAVVLSQAEDAAVR